VRFAIKAYHQNSHSFGKAQRLCRPHFAVQRNDSAPSSLVNTWAKHFYAPSAVAETPQAEQEVCPHQTIWLPRERPGNVAFGASPPLLQDELTKAYLSTRTTFRHWTNWQRPSTPHRVLLSTPVTRRNRRTQVTSSWNTRLTLHLPQSVKKHSYRYWPDTDHAELHKTSLHIDVTCDFVRRECRTLLLWRRKYKYCANENKAPRYKKHGFNRLNKGLSTQQ
jgi:hypothetical protein